MSIDHEKLNREVAKVVGADVKAVCRDGADPQEPCDQDCMFNGDPKDCRWRSENLLPCSTDLNLADEAAKTHLDKGYELSCLKNDDGSIEYEVTAFHPRNTPNTPVRGKVAATVICIALLAAHGIDTTEWEKE